MCNNSPNKRDMLTQCWIDVGPHSVTPDQHQTNVGRVYHVSWNLLRLLRY